jgi:hypothetical protein
MVEANYFENTEETVTNHYAGPTGRCVARNNVLVGRCQVEFWGLASTGRVTL